MILMTFRSAVDAVKKEIRREGPDFVYEKSPEGSCQNYDEHGNPSCLAGRVFFDHGFTLSTDEDTRECARFSGVFSFLEYMQLDEQEHYITSAAEYFLSEIQQHQDNGCTWLDSYRQALQYSYRTSRSRASIRRETELVRRLKSYGYTDSRIVKFMKEEEDSL